MVSNRTRQAVAKAHAQLFEVAPHDFVGLVEVLQEGLVNVLRCDRAGAVFVIAPTPEPGEDPRSARRTYTMTGAPTPEALRVLTEIRTTHSYLTDPCTRALMDGLGKTRVELRSDHWDEAFMDTKYARDLIGAGLRDAIYSLVPVGEGVEVGLAGHMTGEDRFSHRHKRRFLAYVNGLEPLLRKVALSYGRLPDGRLTPVERGVLSGLLRGVSEPVNAEANGLDREAYEACIAAMFDKLDVDSQGELMALWLDWK